MLALLGIILVALWLRDRTAPWLVWWGVPLMLAASGIVFYTLPQWESSLLSILVSNLLRIFALSMLWQGVRVFFHRRPAYIEVALLCAVWAALCLWQPFTSSLIARVAVVSIINAVICLATAAELIRARGEALSSRLPLAAVFGSFGVIMVVRAAAAGVAPFPFGALPLDPIWLASFLLVVFAHATFAGVLFLVMTMERRESAQRSFAMQDPLTGLMNRRAFGEFALRMGRRDDASEASTALLVLDLDHFKSINDRFGHEVGDRMLKLFSEVAEACVRSSDTLYRMGGEEFCFVLPDTLLADAIAIAERIRKTFESRSVGEASATVSIGIAVSLRAIDLDVQLAAADAAVYEAKARGRNRVVVAEPSALLRGSAPNGAQRLTA